MEPKHIYLAVGQNIWGKGFTKGQALDALRAESRDLAKRYIPYAVLDPWAYIDDMGSIVYTPVEGAERQYWEVERQEPTKPVRR